MLFLVLILLVIPISAITLDELLAGYDYNYVSEDFNVTQISHNNTDKDNNQLFDYLTLNITTENSQGNYTFNIDIENINHETTLTIEQNAVTEINISPIQLTEGNKNITLTIYNNTLLYRNLSAYQFYFNETLFERTNINIISHEWLDNNSDSLFDKLAININTTNVTGYLTGNNEILISNVTNNTHLFFNAKEIKQKEMNISRLYLIKTNDYDLYFNYTIEANLEELTTPTMFTGSYQDEKTNNMLRITATVFIEKTGTYTSELSLYDLYNNFIATTTKTETLGQGNHNIQLDINGSSIRKSELNGPYLIKYITIKKDSITKHQEFEPYTTNQYNYDEFINTELPDLTIDITYSNKNLSKNKTQANVTIKNIGNRNAYNVYLDIYDNRTYSEQYFYSELTKQNSKTIVLNFSNETHFRLSAVADLNSIIDEINESNNAMQITLPEPEEEIVEEEEEEQINDNGDTGGNLGGGYTTSYVCKEQWNCTEWSSCINNQQTRTCTAIVKCRNSNPPEIKRSCNKATYNKKQVKARITTEEPAKVDFTNILKPIYRQVSPLTGFATGVTEGKTGNTADILIFVSIAVALFLFIKIRKFYKH